MTKDEALKLYKEGMMTLVERLRVVANDYTATTYNDEMICEAADRIEELEKSLRLVQRHHATAWNRGHTVGSAGASIAMKQAERAKQSYLDENERLTNVLLEQEKEIESLRAKITSWKERFDTCAEKLNDLSERE